MYCVVYEFRVKAGSEKVFESSWAKATEAIHRVCGSLGSRLHRTAEPLVYVAYAQWPSRAVFEREVPDSAYTAEERAQRLTMKESLESIKRVYFLEMLDDRLQA
jgi:heme-degrading monooxygenase HmoA